MYCINYVVVKGDSLYKLSRHWGIEISAIIDANPLINVYNLIVGETICIPVSVPSNNYTNYTTYLVEDGDTLGGILEKSDINLADLLEYNSLMDLHLLPGTTLKVPIAGEGVGGITL